MNPLRRRAWSLLCVLLMPHWVSAQPVVVPRPTPRDMCPVCGMVVSKYPTWTATVVFRSGHAHHFDGAKDLFKFLHDVERYAPGHRRADILTMAVTDYYDLERIDAMTAWYVVGSRVHGPMGHEFVPLRTQDDAKEFMRDHGGRKVLRFSDIDRGWPQKLDSGKFD